MTHLCKQGTAAAVRTPIIQTCKVPSISHVASLISCNPLGFTQLSDVISRLFEQTEHLRAVFWGPMLPAFAPMPVGVRALASELPGEFSFGGRERC